jgi:hypothetical protein
LHFLTLIDDNCNHARIYQLPVVRHADEAGQKGRRHERRRLQVGYVLLALLRGWTIHVAEPHGEGNADAGKAQTARLGFPRDSRLDIYAQHSEACALAIILINGEQAVRVNDRFAEHVLGVPTREKAEL